MKTILSRPFYSDTKNGIKIYSNDCVDVMKSLESESVDMIFADPPYFGNQSGHTINRSDGSESFSTKKFTWAKKQAINLQLEFHFSWLAEAKRLLKPSGTIWVTGTYHSIGSINVVMHDMGFKILNEIILFKKNAPPNFKGTCFRAVTENMLWAKASSRGKKKFNYWDLKEMNGGKQMSNLWEYTAKKNPFRHPATKQPIILEKCILACTETNDLVLDPFSGSGTTGYVAKALGRKCILIENNSDYCQLSKLRIQGKYGNYQSQMNFA